MAALSGPAPASCPAGMPTQAITVVNQAHVSRFALAKVENAMTDQSVQLRAAWGTPCVTFATGGWVVFLQARPVETAHFINLATDVPWAVVATSGLNYQAWSLSLSHELVEMLVDPSTTRSYTHNPEQSNLEVADPVENSAYRLDGTWVSDFVTPAWYAGGTFGECETDVTFPNGPTPVDTINCGGPLIAATDAPGPYDQMHTLSAPWDAR